LGGDGGGAFFYYRTLAQLLGPNQPSYAIRSPEKPLSTIEDMANRYIQEIRAIQPAGPYHLGGFSFGGVVAFEIARQLKAQTAQVGAVIMMDSLPPNQRHRLSWNPRYLLACLRHAKYWVAALELEHPHHLLAEFKRKRKAVLRLVRDWSGRSHAAPTLDEVLDMSEYPKQYVTWAQAHWDALCRYHPEAFSGTVILVRASQQRLSDFDPDLGWRPLAKGGVRTFVIPGSHENMMQVPRVQLVAAHVNTCLRELQGPETVS
jgi:thioesterase domain-containing protein